MSAKGSLKKARDPRFQALFAIRGVSLNCFRVEVDQIIGPKGNKEFTDLTMVMGCNVGPKFDLNRLQFNKIIIASDADIDGYFIRSLLMAFYFKCFPQIIEDGRLYIAEPPLYRVDDKKNPFIINKMDYIKRYVDAVTKAYKIGWIYDSNDLDINWMKSDEVKEFLDSTSQYVDIMHSISDHYKINERMVEIIYEQLAWYQESYLNINYNNLLNRINEEFPEIYYDEKDKLIKGVIDGKYQLIEINNSLVHRGDDIIKILKKWIHDPNMNLVLRNRKTGTQEKYSMLNILKILKKFQPNILHRFKGLGENDDEDIKTTIMDPNTRMLIRVQMGDIENDMKIMQMLRGGTSYDAQMRKLMMKEYKIPRELIDT